MESEYPDKNEPLSIKLTEKSAYASSSKVKQVSLISALEKISSNDAVDIIYDDEEERPIFHSKNVYKDVTRSDLDLLKLTSRVESKKLLRCTDCTILSFTNAARNRITENYIDHYTIESYSAVDDKVQVILNFQYQNAQRDKPYGKTKNLVFVKNQNDLCGESRVHTASETAMQLNIKVIGSNRLVLQERISGIYTADKLPSPCYYPDIT